MPASPDILSAFDHDTHALLTMIDAIPEADWERDTPAEGWTVRDQVAHVAFVFDLARSACADPPAFSAALAAVAEHGFEQAVNGALVPWGAGTTQDVLGRLRQARSAVAQALSEVSTPTVPWLQNPLPPDVLTMAGMLETLAHGQDIADAVGVVREHTDTLAYIVHFVHRTRDFGYLGTDLTPPENEFRFEVELPSGRVLEVGPTDSPDVVRGPALDLCLLAARRRHVDDLALTATGRAAEWLPLAQAYRGPGGAGRRPGQFAAAQ
ncbi:maleylpyruvate isomerase family mycothiol-dependent enzyme [Kineosporia succinea]|uniref:Uncharacterized protein (TIGR03084 family) n=1 Tax=Kineosporia succinea TaxID=84632 RepID=A0ABT9PAH3_9ACTN|nr:maleylpyruvate isomerase family mycothiol-dependent enzyme [Kineosporia succinea]MDP9829675.1 uncharacterized protein (TIGR03084 family) [Kineosporia succinea]